MIFTKDSLQKVKLVMFSRKDLPASEMKEVNGKKTFVKNGLMTEMTEYTFRDESGQTLVLLTKDNSYRTLEGELVDIVIDVSINDFTGKVAVKLVSVQKSHLQLS